MSVFEIVQENGLYRRLRSDEGLETPLLLDSLHSKFNQVILTERGNIRLNEIVLNNLNFSENYHTELEEWSILTPRLTINFRQLPETQIIEEEIYLERINKQSLPKAFGLVFNPFSSNTDFLQKLLEFGPSVIVLRFNHIEKMPASKVYQTITKIRNIIPPDIAIYLAGGVPVGFFALFIYLGIDIFDDNSAYRSASFSYTYDDGFFAKDTQNVELNTIIQTNLDQLKKEFSSTLKHLNDNTAWKRIARDMHSHPMIAAIVTLIAKDKGKYLSLTSYSSLQTNPLNFTGDEAFAHPDVLKYHQLLLRNYQLPKSKKLLILLPCSAKKPYQESKSHRAFIKSIKQASKKHFGDIQIWSLTSPIGIVPRELERIYPNMYYDLPVTGNWSYEESEKCGLILKEMVSTVDLPIIVHVSKGYKTMVEIGLEGKQNVISWIGEKPANMESQKTLKQNIEQGIERIKPSENMVSYNSAGLELDVLVKYHHGRDCEIDFHGIKSLGRPPRPVQIQRNKIHLLSWDVFKGKINLSLEAAKEIAHTTEKWVIVDTDELKGSSLFAVGVIEVSEKISPDDEILIFNKSKSKLLGVGAAIVSGKTMKSLNYGRVASLRKKGVIDLD